MNKEIEIPDGYEARIEGNKVIIKQKESEDERIRKYIVKFVELEKGVNLPPDDADKMLAYLEKQKDEAQRQFNLGMQAGREEVLYKMEKEQQPTEWSEEDEKWIDRACMLLNELNDLSHLTLAKIPSNVDEIIAHIKSLRPQPRWKPSDEQMKALEYGIDDIRFCNLGKERLPILQSLYNDLEKLM